MDVDNEGFCLYRPGYRSQVRFEYGEVVAEIERTPEREGGGRVGLPPPPERVPGQGGRGPVANFIAPPGGWHE